MLTSLKLISLKKISLVISVVVSILFCNVTFAQACFHPWYVAANAGVYQGIFNQNYHDNTDLIPQSIRQPIYQYAYTFGLAAGYSTPICNGLYVLGAELSGNYNTQNANFAAGAATAAFNDVNNIRYQFDLLFVPGIALTECSVLYGKIGLSYAEIRDALNSPVGFAPVLVGFNSTQNVFGLALSIGLKKYINDNFSIFTEVNYHDYGTVNFSGFQNFTANYSHSAHVYSEDLVVGVAFSFC